MAVFSYRAADRTGRTVDGVMEAYDSQAVVERLSDLLARHRMENEGLLASKTGQQLTAKQEEYRASFLKKMFSYFEL